MRRDLVRRHVPGAGLFDRAEELFVLDRLVQQLDDARPLDARFQLRIVSAGHHQRGNANVLRPQSFQKFQPRHLGHVKVDDHTIAGNGGALQEKRGRGVAARRIAVRLQKGAHGVAHGIVVFDDVYDEGQNADLRKS
jgi:hypothetical protein